MIVQHNAKLHEAFEESDDIFAINLVTYHFT